MKKIIKLLVWAAGLMLVLAIVAIAAFAFLFDPNNFRDDITRAVENKTGRQLIIEGDLSLTYFPWLGFEVGRLTLSNPQGFSKKFMATVESASASVKILPLLKRQIELSTVKFDGVDLKLEILANGSDNWTNLTRSSDPATADHTGNAFTDVGINGIHLGNTRISYTNARSGDAYRASKLQLETGVVAPGKPFSLTASAEVASERDEIAGLASITTEVQLGDNNTVYMRQANMEINATGNAVPGDQLRLKMQSPQLEVTTLKIKLEKPQMQFSGAGSGDPWATIEGQASGQSLALALENKTITLTAPILQLKGTSTNELWTTLDGVLKGQTLLLQMEQNNNTITMALPNIQIAGTSTGDTWATLNGTVYGPSIRLLSDKVKDKNTIVIDSPIMQVSGTATGQAWSSLESSGKGQSLVLQIEENADTLTIAAPNFQLVGTGRGDPWSAMKGAVKGQSLQLLNYDLVDIPTMQVSGRISGKDLPGGYVDMAMTSERLQGSIEQENFTIDVAQAELLDLSVFSKKIKVSSVIEAPQIEAAIQVGKFSPLKLMKKLGYDNIVTTDKTALSSATISGNASYSPERMGISNIVGTVDQTAVTGSVNVMASGETRFSIVADTVNLDRYRSPSKSTAEIPGQATTVADFEIPTQALRGLAIDAALKVGKMQLIGLHSSDVEFTVRAGGGDIRINPAQAKLYGGTYTGDIHLNAKGKVPVLSMNEKFEGVQFGPFTEDLLGRKRLTGTLSGRMTIVGSGTNSNQITNSSNGDAVFKFIDGTYLGVDIWHKVRSARALIKREQQPTDPPSDRTRFGDLNGTAKIVNGVLRTDDLNAVMPQMTIRGSGTLALLTQKVDFKFVGDVYDRPGLTGADNELVGYPLPIKLTGTTSAPQVGVDMGGLLAELAKRKLLGKFGVGARTTPEPHDDPNTEPNAQPAAMPTPAEKVQEIKKQAEEKIKDKLKGLLGGGAAKQDPDPDTVGGG